MGRLGVIGAVFKIYSGIATTVTSFTYYENAFDLPEPYRQFGKIALAGLVLFSLYVTGCGFRDLEYKNKSCINCKHDTIENSQ